MQHVPLRVPTLGIVLREKAGPALGFAAFVAWAVLVYSQRAARLRRLRWRRDRVVQCLVERRRQRRGPDGRFLAVKPLQHELATVNEQLHIAVA